MSPAVVLAIVVATQNVDDQATEAMRATAAEALGGEDTVVVRELDAISDAEALRIEHRIAAQAVAQVQWLDPEHTRARVRVHAVENSRWSERTITFAVVDTSVERGRALGFAVTSMLPEEVLAALPHAGGRDLAGADPNAGRDFGTALVPGLPVEHRRRGHRRWHRWRTLGRIRRDTGAVGADRLWRAAGHGDPAQ